MNGLLELIIATALITFVILLALLLDRDIDAQSASEDPIGKKLWSAITGEWMLRRGCPNGGAVIFFRSVQVTFPLYVIACWLHSLLNA